MSTKYFSILVFRSIRICVFILVLILVAQGCSPGEYSPREGSFGEAIDFLKQHTTVLVLDDGAGAQVAVVPAMQGRVMTSTFAASTSCRLSKE